MINENKIDILLKNGYECYKRSSESFIQFSFNNIYHRANFNTTQPDGITVYFVKNEDFEDAIPFGLSELNKPPSFYYPYPTIKYENGITVIETVFSIRKNRFKKLENIKAIDMSWKDRTFYLNYIKENKK